MVNFWYFCAKSSSMWSGYHSCLDLAMNMLTNVSVNTCGTLHTLATDYGFHPLPSTIGCRTEESWHLFLLGDLNHRLSHCSCYGNCWYQHLPVPPSHHSPHMHLYTLMHVFFFITNNMGESHFHSNLHFKLVSEGKWNSRPLYTQNST